MRANEGVQLTQTNSVTMVIENHPEGDLTGWVLAESRLSVYRRYVFGLSMKRRSRLDRTIEIPLPVGADGRIQELIWLPDDVERLEWQPPEDGLTRPVLTIRRIGWFDRTLRMASRVFWTYIRLSKDERSESGMTFWRALGDLPQAFRIASGFRVRYPPVRYSDWIDRFDALRESDVQKICSHLATFPSRPRFRLMLAARAHGLAQLRTTLATLDAQLYRDFTCVVFDLDGTLATSGIGEGASEFLRVVKRDEIAAWLEDFNARNEAESAGEWVMLMDAGDTLPRHALYWFAFEALMRKEAAVIYSDDDRVDAEGSRSEPRFKPDWSPEHFQSAHYIGASAILRRSAIVAAGGIYPAFCLHGNYELMLRMIDAGGRIEHVCAVLYHRGKESHAGKDWEDPRWCAEALRVRLARNRTAAEVLPMTAGWRVRYSLPQSPPFVTVIVPTRDAETLLRNCVESVLAKTEYPCFEILIVDNGSTDIEALEYLNRVAAQARVRVLRYDRPFNYAAINNFAVHEASGECLCLLNNDTEVISAGWLGEMMGHLLQPGVGAVGAKLYYPDGSVQHAGVAFGPGAGANHLHLGLQHDAPGYCGRAMLAQEYSAVTAACMLTWKRLYLELGGLNERKLPVSFNDVDFCLRLQELGWRVVFTPHAQLLHHESATRGRDDSGLDWLRAYRERMYMRARWPKRFMHDPYYNPNLSYRRADFSLGETERVDRPWRPHVL